MSKLFIGFQITILFLLVSGVAASYPVRGIEDYVKGFESGTIELERISHAYARQVIIEFEKKLTVAREQQKVGSIEKPWTTSLLRNSIEQESLLVIKRLNAIDLKYAIDVVKTYKYFAHQLDRLRVKKESEGNLKDVGSIDNVLRELQFHPRLKYAQSVIDASGTATSVNSHSPSAEEQDQSR